MRNILASPSSVKLARIIYIIACLAAGLAIALSTRSAGVVIPPWAGLGAGLVVACIFILLETLMQGFTLRGFSTGTFGLGVGLFCAWLLTRVDISSLLNLALKSWLLTGEGAASASAEASLATLRMSFEVALFASLGYIGIVLALRSNRDDFAFVIPYVRFRQDATAGRPVVLDTDAVIDGRAAAVLKCGFLHGRIIVPRFILDELQNMATSASQAQRHRGQRGLDTLRAMQREPLFQVSIHDSPAAATEESTARRLVEIVRLLDARLLTASSTISHLAKLQGIEALNIYDLDEAMRPNVAVGDRIRLPLVRGGKEDHQGVGYLPDGTMIVVNHGASRIGHTVEANVISAIQTHAGRMVFADLHVG